MKPAPPPAAVHAVWPTEVPVLIAGGGPVGMTLAALLANQGIKCLLVEADTDYCSGSRAICISRRSQEIFAWIGADRALVDKGLSWTGGRSYYRGTEVLNFSMPSDPTQRFAPMVNIQQFYVEAFAHRAALAGRQPADVRWGCRLSNVRRGDDHADVDIETPGGGQQTVRTRWLVACDGGRSTVRENLGLQFEGVQYEGRYVIVDIRQPTQRPVERLAWFDPPSNPGSTLLMHRQPDDVWRIDYQIRDDEDPSQAVLPENVLPRVQSHLTMIGETAPWTPLWISIYNAKCLTLREYRHGPVLFAGDAAHLVPIFGVRGLNSGLDDAANLAWKLALVIQGRAQDALLDSYSAERLHAARENMAYGAKSTEFMAPPHFGFRLMREAALRLALESGHVRSLINPRQTTPISYPRSPLNLPTDGSRGPGPGDPAPEARLADRHLSQVFGHHFVGLWFADDPLPGDLAAEGAGQLTDSFMGACSPAELAWLSIPSRADLGGTDRSASSADIHGEAWERYAANDGDVVLVRPDGYVLARWHRPDRAAVRNALIHACAGSPVKNEDLSAFSELLVNLP